MRRRQSFAKRKTGSVASKKVVKGGLSFASSLEAYCHTRLTESGFEFQYEGESFSLVDSFKYESTYLKSTSGKNELVDNSGKVVRAITYTPDFISHKNKFIIETKGYVPSNHSFPLRWKLFLKYLNENGMGDYKVFLPKNKTQVDEVINKLKNE